MIPVFPEEVTEVSTTLVGMRPWPRKRVMAVWEEVASMVPVTFFPRRLYDSYLYRGMKRLPDSHIVYLQKKRSSCYAS